MLSKIPARQRLQELAKDAIKKAGNGGPDAWQLWENWVRRDSDLMRAVAEDALRGRAQYEVGIAAREMRADIIKSSGPPPMSTSKVKVTSELAAVSTKLAEFMLPIPGRPMLRDATCAQAADAIRYYREHARPFAVNVRWLEMMLGNREPDDAPLLGRGMMSEKKLRELREKAEREVR